MWNFKKFNNNSAYATYLKGDDVWLPRVAYILNSHVEEIDPSTHRDIHENESDWSDTPDSTTGLARGGDNKRWVDFTQLGNHFIEVANGGTMYFKNIQDPSLASDESQNYGWYTASVSDGMLIINTPEGKATVDNSTGVLQFINFPNDIYSYGGMYTE